MAGAKEVKGDESSKIQNLNISNIEQEIKRLSNIKDLRTQNYCKIGIIGEYYPANAARIIKISQNTKNDSIITKSIMAVILRKNNDTDFKNAIDKCENNGGPTIDFPELENKFGSVEGEDVFSWINKPEWQSLKEGVKKDKDLIYKASGASGVEPRLIVSSMIVEQLRLFYSEREIFKKFFGPLKILCSANKISLGVMGIKEETAKKIENNLKDKSSPCYLGQEYENLLDFDADDISSERYDRLSSDKNHYYSYLYGSLYIKQMMKQWNDAGYPIDYRPEIIGTLFNVGFPQSKPNPDPKVGGSHIDVGGVDYSFGALAYEFYYSGELLDDFPYQVN